MILRYEYDTMACQSTLVCYILCCKPRTMLVRALTWLGLEYKDTYAGSRI
jgi:hypothetical protein